MKKLSYIFLLTVALCFAACGEDRTHEYEELIAHNKWMFSVMRDNYLWGDLIQEQDDKTYFYTSTRFFSTLVSSTGQKDSWSYCLVDSAPSDPHARGHFNHLDTYGIDYVMATDPTKATSRSMARVTYVAQGSPAAQCGLQRNAFISVVDDTRLTSSNASKYLESGESHSIVFHHIDTIEGGSYVWTDTVRTTLPASTLVVEDAFPVHSIFTVAGGKIGYLLCTRLMPYPDECKQEGTEFQEQLDHCMQNLLQHQPTDLVLDLRYCNYGTVEMAQRLASYLLPTIYQGTPFAQTIWNSSHAANNTTYTYQALSGTLDLSRVFIITSNYTQGAAEWLIQALKTTIGDANVILIGQATKGQNVMTSYVASGYGHQLYPAVAYVADGEGNYNYGSFSPATANTITETNVNFIPYMKPLGDPEELLFMAALEAIFNM